MKVAFTVLGTPASQGSKRHVGGGVMVESSKALRPWRETVALAAFEERGSLPTLTGPVNLSLTFRVPRPKTHFRTGKHAGELKPDAPTFSPKKPDIDKLVRAICDSLTTAGVWFDDSQVVTLHARKVYASADRLPGVDVHAEEIGFLIERTA